VKTPLLAAATASMATLNRAAAGILPVKTTDPATLAVGRKFNQHPVARKDADMVLAHLARKMP